VCPERFINIGSSEVWSAFVLANFYCAFIVFYSHSKISSFKEMTHAHCCVITISLPFLIFKTLCFVGLFGAVWEFFIKICLSWTVFTLDKFLKCCHALVLRLYSAAFSSIFAVLYVSVKVRVAAVLVSWIFIWCFFIHCHGQNLF
jgi:hypothetical protein